MRRKTVVILALVLVFALMFTACAVRRPLQTPVQPRTNTTGQYDNNRGIGTTTGVGTRTGVGTNTYTGYGPSAYDPYGMGYGTGNPTYYGGGYDNGLYGGYGVDYRNMGGSNNYPNYGLNNTAGTTQADRIERSVEQMTGVNNATVVVSGNTAYVALDTNGDMTGRNISYRNTTGIAAMKQACAQRVRSTNPQIRTVYVSTDANFGERLRRVGEGVRSGNPISSFTNELNNLVRSLTPERQ